MAFSLSPYGGIFVLEESLNEFLPIGWIGLNEFFVLTNAPDWTSGGGQLQGPFLSLDLGIPILNVSRHWSILVGECVFLT